MDFGSTYELPVATVTDDIDEERTVEPVITNAAGEEVEAVDTRVAGEYTLTYNAKDAVGNEAATVTIIVNVEAPVTVTTLTQVSTSKLTLAMDGAETELTKDNFVLEYTPEGATESVAIPGVAIVEDADIAGTYIVTFNDLKGQEGTFNINGTNQAFDYTETGLKTAVEAVNDSISVNGYASDKDSG